jgi:CheY-like chemotaxis protein
MHKILYVEDNEDNIYMLTQRLQREGFEVLIARNGAEGITMAGAQRPHLIIMDLVLPEIDGWEATRRLKADPELGAIPILALSASVMSGDPDKAFEAGCDDFEFKPVDFPQLLGKIEKLLKS